MTPSLTHSDVGGGGENTFTARTFLTENRKGVRWFIATTSFSHFQLCGEVSLRAWHSLAPFVFQHLRIRMWVLCVSSAAESNVPSNKAKGKRRAEGKV